jgi:hypothetical protein
VRAVVTVAATRKRVLPRAAKSDGPYRFPGMRTNV